MLILSKNHLHRNIQKNVRPNIWSLWPSHADKNLTITATIMRKNLGHLWRKEKTLKPWRQCEMSKHGINSHLNCSVVLEGALSLHFGPLFFFLVTNLIHIYHKECYYRNMSRKNKRSIVLGQLG